MFLLLSLVLIGCDEERIEDIYQNCEKIRSFYKYDTFRIDYYNEIPVCILYIEEATQWNVLRRPFRLYANNKRDTFSHFLENVSDANNLIKFKKNH